MLNSEMKMTYSAILRDKDNNKVVRVQFERDNDGKHQVAEGLLPDGKIVRSSGYTPDELKKLEEYLCANSKDIFSKAKVISNPLKWL